MDVYTPVVPEVRDDELLGAFLLSEASGKDERKQFRHCTHLLCAIHSRSGTRRAPCWSRGFGCGFVLLGVGPVPVFTSVIKE